MQSADSFILVCIPDSQPLNVACCYPPPAGSGDCPIWKLAALAQEVSAAQRDSLVVLRGDLHSRVTADHDLLAPLPHQRPYPRPVVGSFWAAGRWACPRQSLRRGLSPRQEIGWLGAAGAEGRGRGAGAGATRHGRLGAGGCRSALRQGPQVRQAGGWAWLLLSNSCF